MTASFEDRLQLINAKPQLLQALAKLQRGIEKESLRIKPDATLALSPHSKLLGSALCHPKITTDYSESLVELITPVHTSVSSCLLALDDTHRFTYQQLAKDQELLWQASMPCILPAEEDIPVALYGSSNVAKMKTVYRLGLGLRYGRVMQTISGIHYNFSLSDTFWLHYQKAIGNTQPAKDFKSEQYFDLIRNFKRLAPVFVYLFGSSPALAKSFIEKQEHDLQSFDEQTLFNPYATSLRMGDLGYQSSAQEALFVCYNGLENYLETLLRGINESHPDYAKLGVRDAQGEFQQLNTALLQIENEFYSIVRPKRVAATGEAPINALARDGVEYIEIRCIDVNPFCANGIDASTIEFLDMLLLFCLFSPSPEATDKECNANNSNLKKVVSQGRDPNLMLDINDQPVPFKDFAEKLLADLQPLAATMDSLRADNRHQRSLELQAAKIADSALTPSAKVLQIMTDDKLSFTEFAQRQSLQWQAHYLAEDLSADKQALFSELAANSLAAQKALEKASKQDFADYLSEYYQQYKHEV